MNLTGPRLGAAGTERADTAADRAEPNPFDQIADLDLASAELTQRADTLDREYRAAAAAIAALGERAEPIVGTGTAEERAVRVVVDDTGRISEVHLDPRALRLGSIGRLEQAIVSAATQASADLARQLDAELGDPVRALYAAMPELSALLGGRGDDPFGANPADTGGADGDDDHEPEDRR